MPLPTSSLAKICNKIRDHVDLLGQPTSPTDWDIKISIGAPGANLAANNDVNTLNLFFYRFEPFGFAADALPSDVQWMKVFCVITAFGVDEDSNPNDELVDFSAGFNELRMLAQVMRLFQEQPVMLIDGDNEGEVWHTQFIPRPLADEQINQIWSTQGETIYRPSVVYEIALVPIEPEISAPQAARVASIGTFADSDMSNRHSAWPNNRETRYFPPASIAIDTSNPQWAPAIVMLTGGAGERKANLTLNIEIPVSGGLADFNNFPQIDIWLGGNTNEVNALSLVGQLLQNPETDQGGGRWHDIDDITGQNAEVVNLDMQNIPDTTAFTLEQTHWTNINNSHSSWQLQLFAERRIRYNAETGAWDNVSLAEADIRIRSNPVLLTLTREAS